MKATRTMHPNKKTLLERWTHENIITDPRVLQAFTDVPREHFVQPQLRKHAYDDEALPLLDEQTISQPTTVMLMTQALEPKPGHKILEIGAGSGYQAALLSKLVEPEGQVITLEILPSLCRLAKHNLKPYKNVRVIHADGTLGYDDEAPYDRIIVTAASDHTPEALLDQLTTGGILLIPLGTPYAQQMIKIKKLNDRLERETLGDFLFVPLRGKHGMHHPLLNTL